MMKRIFLSAIFLVNPIFVQQSDTPNERVEMTLRKIEQNNNQTQSLSYRVAYQAIQPDLEDSVNLSEGQVWLSRISADSIFGCRLHVLGKDHGGAFDYYYDGQSSYEIRHADRTITVFHPQQYPNNPSNPAKARTALNLFVDLLVKKNTTELLLQNIKNESLESHENALLLEYSPNEFGQVVKRKIRLDTSRTQIIGMETKVQWRGTTFTTIVTIQSIQRNSEIKEDDLALTKQYPNYIVKEFRWPASGDSKVDGRLVGSVAPDFSFPDFAGDAISLAKLRGKVVLLDFWESWCGYCLLAFPKLNDLHTEYEKKGLLIIGVTTENSRQVMILGKANHLKYRNIIATPDILHKYNVSARPTYILINREGRIEKVSFGDLDIIKSKLTDLIQ